MGKLVRHGSRILVLVLLAALPVVAGYSSGSAGVEPARQSVRGKGSRPAPDIVKDRYIVTLNNRTVARDRIGATASGLMSAAGGQVMRTYGRAVHGFSARMSADAARKLAQDPSVRSVEPVYRFRASATQPDPPSWGLDRIDQAYQPLNNAYTYTTTASNVTAYVVDSGIQYSHQDFGGRATFGYDASGGDGSDCNGHGTAIAGVIGGTTMGVAKAVDLVSVRVLDCDGIGDTDTVVGGLDWILVHRVAGPVVVNMSLGGPVDPTVDAAVANVIATGATVVAAAGNEDWFACDFSPARVTGAITVGATDISDTRWQESNWGNCVDVFAPGVDITTDYIGSDTSTAVGTGTSLAAPHVSGAAALMLSAHPDWAPAVVQRQMAENSARIHRIATTQQVNPPPVPEPSGSWQAGNPPPVGTSSRVAIVSNGDRVDAFVAGTGFGRPVLHATLTGTTWSAWESLDGATLGNPVAVWISSTRLEVYVTGADHSAWRRTWDGAWHPWEWLGGYVNNADLAVASPEPGVVDVYAISGDSAVWQRNWDGDAWTSWNSFGGRTSRHNFSVIADPFSGAEVVFAQGGDGALYYKYFDSLTIPGGWVSLGGQFRWDIKGVFNTDGTIDVFVPGVDKAVWFRHWLRTAGWTDWINLGGVVSGDGVEAVAWDLGITQVYARSTDSRVWTKRKDAAWGAWSLVSPELSSNIPAVTGVLTYQLEIAFPRAAGGVYAARWSG